MASLSNTCEGTNAATVSTTNSAGPNQLDATSLSGAGTTCTWDNAHAHSGSTALKNHLPTVAASVYQAWKASISPSPVANAYVRFYLYLTAYPTVTTRIVMFTVVPNLRSALQITTTGTIRTLTSAGATIATTTAAVPLNAWCRIEYEVTGISGTTGAVAARMFSGANLETTTADTGGSLSNTGQTVGGTIDEVRFGHSSSVTMTTAWDTWYDDIAWSDTATPGPSVTAASDVPPTAFRRMQYLLVR